MLRSTELNNRNWFKIIGPEKGLILNLVNRCGYTSVAIELLTERKPTNASELI